jgi:hypothetical protein
LLTGTVPATTANFYLGRGVRPLGLILFPKAMYKGVAHADLHHT